MSASVTIRSISGRAIPVSGNDIDTDRIIPARFLRCVTFDGLGEHAFEDDRKQLKAQGKTHAWDDTRFTGARVLVVNSNFGCGSSREHAPQALNKWGITAIVGVSFSDIFYGNCVAMGLPCLRVSVADSEAIQAAVVANPTVEVTVDIDALEVRAGGTSWKGQMGAGHRQQFLTGQWDATSELIAGLAQVKATAKRLPYTSAFA
jgi:3-isopropylmalate/(R)-2-methylmalate dehydratase small subunit